jgi:hypothetical protein
MSLAFNFSIEAVDSLHAQATDDAFETRSMGRDNLLQADRL